MPNDWISTATSHLRESIKVKEAVIDNCLPDLLAVCEVTAKAFTNGNKLLICGNGGSAADAQHLAAEFISTLSTKFERRALPALALTTDSTRFTLGKSRRLVSREIFCYRSVPVAARKTAFARWKQPKNEA